MHAEMCELIQILYYLMEVRSNFKLDPYLLQERHTNSLRLQFVFRSADIYYTQADVLRHQINTHNMHVFRYKKSHRKYTSVQII